MRPGEVLDAQIDLLTRVQHSPAFRRILGAWAQAEFQYLGEADTDAVPTILTQHVRNAYPYRVTHDMTSMVQWMAGQFDGTDQFMADLAPTPWGFVSFDKPLPITDARGKTMLVHFLVWGPSTVGTNRYGGTERALAVWCFNDTWRQPDQVQQELWAKLATDAYAPMTAEAYNHAVGRWATVGLDILFDEQRLGPPTIKVTNPDHVAEILEAGETPTDAGTNTTRLVHALWLLLGQSVVTKDPERADRPARRRADKAGIPSSVTVVRLRRSEQHGERPEGESLVQWTHRWIVRQHWRWQPYGPRKHVEHVHQYGPTQVERGGLVQRCVVDGCENYLARIIIPMAVKGPEGAPLVQSEKVYDLSR